MAIADLVHCEGLSFSFAESPRLMTVIKIARTVGNDFTPPSRRQVSGKLLTNNYNSTHEESLASLTDDADIFGLTFLGDGATIKKMPLINALALAMTGTTPPVVLSIEGCIEHRLRAARRMLHSLQSFLSHTLRKLTQPRTKPTYSFLTVPPMSRRPGGSLRQSILARTACTEGSMSFLSSLQIWRSLNQLR